LLEAVGQASSIAAAKSPKRILECVAVRASKADGVRIEANDLDVSLRVDLAEATTDEDGVVAVPAQRLVSVLREVGDGRPEITLVGADGRLEIDTPECHFRIHGEDPAEFHAPDAFPSTGSVAVPFGVLRRMVERTQFATAREPGRFALHGVQFRFTAHELEVVATDGRRLAKAVHPLAAGPATELKVIVGTKPLAFLGRLASDDAANVDVAVADRRIYFRCGGSLLSSRLIDGAFPPYDQVIPSPSAKGFTAKVGELVTALRRAALLTTKELRSVSLDVGTDRLTLSSRSPEVGEAKVDLPVAYQEAPERLGFNPDYLLDALKVMDPASDVRFEFTTPRAPGKLTDGPAYVYVVSPVSVAE
jgi:DNA polymerase-3 subunit beta